MKSGAGAYVPPMPPADCTCTGGWDKGHSPGCPSVPEAEPYDKERLASDMQQLARLQQLEQLHAEGRRWNCHEAGDGRIQVCKGDHERGTSCQYVTFAPVRP